MAALLPASLGCAVAVALFATGCDDQMERQIGEMSARSIEKEYRVVDDPLATQWLQNMGHSLVGQSLRQSIPYSFKILDTDLVNAFAAPYGYIYVTTGLLDFAESEDEVWGVVGHEVGHVQRRHAMSAVKRGFLYEIGLAILGNQNRTLADIGGIGLGLLALSYSRDNEYEADDMARTLTYAAGRDPQGNIAFFQRLMEKYEKKKPSSIAVMFSTHPPTASRIARQKLFPEMSDKEPEALLHTARGYARRYQYKTAEGLLTKAAALAPGHPAVLMALADAQIARGEYAQAADSLRSAAAAGGGAYAAARLRVASSAVARQPEPASDAERARTATLRQDVQDAVREAATMVGESQIRTAALASSLQRTIAGTHSILKSLSDLSELTAGSSASKQSLALYLNSVVNRALDPIYSAERQTETLQMSARSAERVLQATAARLDEGTLASGDVIGLERAVREAKRCLEDVRVGVRDLEAAAPALHVAQQSATESTRYVERLLRGDRSPSLQRLAQLSAQDTESRALTALAKTQTAKKVTDRAVLRALVARLNLAGVGARPEIQDALDGLVARYVMQRPGLVGQLRREALGYGDVALLLAAAKSIKTDPVELARLGSGAHSMVDQISSTGAQTYGARILLRYLAAAMESETGT